MTKVHAYMGRMGVGLTVNSTYRKNTCTRGMNPEAESVKSRVVGERRLMARGAGGICGGACV